MPNGKITVRAKNGDLVSVEAPVDLMAFFAVAFLTGVALVEMFDGGPRRRR